MNLRFSFLFQLSVLLIAGCSLFYGCRKKTKEIITLPAETILSTFDKNCICPVHTHSQTPGGEGLWPWYMLSSLDEGALRFRGLEIPLQDLWSSTGEGLFQAVVQLNGCTAAFVSPQGLLLTNYRCVVDAIQKASTPQRDLVEEGFIAHSREQEVPLPDLKVRIFRRQRDITDTILRNVPTNVSDLEIVHFIQQREQEAIAQCEHQSNLRCQVFRESEGLHFWLIESLEIQDIRLVISLPDAIASFGKEKEIWRWPRHNLDFAFLRAYVRSDGTPGAFSSNNIPYLPLRFLSISTEGAVDGDFIMVPGVPKRTYRYQTSKELLDVVEHIYPKQENFFSRWIHVLRRVEEIEPNSERFHQNLLRRLHDARMYVRGQVEGITRNRLVARRLSDEESLRRWLLSSRFVVTEKFETLDTFLASIPFRDRDWLFEQMLQAVKVLYVAERIIRWVHERTVPDPQRKVGFRDQDYESFKRLLAAITQEYHPLTDRMVFAMFLDEIDALPPEQRPDFHTPAVTPEEKQRREEWLEMAFRTTTLLDPAVQEKWLLSSRETLLQSTDPILQFLITWYPTLRDMETRKLYVEGALFRLRRSWMQAWKAFKGKQYYPDANGSPRVSFAHITGYSPEDGVWLGTFTSLRGMLAKNRGIAPFALPTSFLDLAQNEEYGPWSAESIDGLPVNFLGNADTSEGNAGSPVLDGKGRIVGLHFDRVVENIASDFGYHPALSRNIMVDVRAILWFLERHAFAHTILIEMGIPMNKKKSDSL